MTAAEFIHNIPQRHNPESPSEQIETCFHYILPGEGGGNFMVYNKDNEFFTKDSLEGTPKCTVRCDANIYVEIVTRKRSASMAMSKQELRIDNMAEMMKYYKVMGLF